MDHREEFRQRLDELLDRQPTSARQIARRLGWSPNTLSNWRTGIRRPKPEDIARLCRLTGESADWLLGLSEDRASEALVAAEPPTVYGLDGSAAAALPLAVSAFGGVPRFERPGGGPIWLSFEREWLQSMIGPVLDERHGFLAHAADDGMQPAIRSGAIVLVRRSRAVDSPGDRPIVNGAVHLVQDADGPLQVRRATLDAGTGRLVLTADDPRFAPSTIDLDGRDVFHVVLGQAVWVGQSLVTV